MYHWFLQPVPGQENDFPRCYRDWKILDGKSNWPESDFEKRRLLTSAFCQLDHYCEDLGQKIRSLCFCSSPDKEHVPLAVVSIQSLKGLLV